MMRVLQKQQLLQLVEQLSSLPRRAAAAQLRACTVCQRHYSEGRSHQQPRDGAYARQRQSERGQQQQRSPYKHRNHQTDQQQQQQLRIPLREPHPSQVAYEQVVQGPQHEIARQRALGKRIKALGETGHAREARQALRIAKDKADLPLNVILFNVTIAAVAKKGMWKDALELLNEMRDEGLQPDKFSYSSAMTACSRGGNWYVTQHYHVHCPVLWPHCKLTNVILNCVYTMTSLLLQGRSSRSDA
jgi:pentatricopeptide repeat protein